MTGKQLKNSILQWAIQGKLVPQDPNDEPASVLLEKIRAEKARLIKEGKIKKDKKESIIYRGEDNSYYEKFADGKVVCIDDEIPFEIPESWQWCRIKHLFSMQAGKNIKAFELSDTPTSSHTYPCYGGNGLRGYVNHYNTEGNFILVGRQGALCGNVKEVKGKFYATEHAVVTNGYGLTNLQWAFYFLWALNLNQYATATAQPGLAVSNIIEVLIPLPPFEEQIRIASKIDNTLLYVDSFTKAQKDLEVLNKEVILNLRKSILQEAIQGKLVPQDPNEESASVLLQRIKEEKQRQVKEDKLKKKDVTDSTIFKGDDNKYYEQIGQEIVDVSDEIPFDLPESWQWTRLGRIVRMSIGKTPARGDASYWAKATKPWVSISDMADYSHIKTTKEKISDTAASTLMGAISPRGSLLMSFKLTVGRTSILDIEAYHNEAIISIYPYIDEEYALRDFLFYSLPILANMGDSKDAIKGKTLNSKSLNSLLIPLPPLKEQRHIIKRLEELYARL